MTDMEDQAAKMASPTPGARISDSATTKFFDITELLEQALLGVDFTTLLLAQQVSTKFSQVIKGSHMLQKKLFQHPVDSFEEAFALGFAEDEGILVSETVIDRKAGTFCGLAFVNSNLIKPSDTFWPEEASAKEHCFELKQSIANKITSTSAGDRGSWEGMMFTQPAMQPMLSIRQFKVRKDESERGTLMIKDGLIDARNLPFTPSLYQLTNKDMGELVDSAFESVREDHPWMLDNELHWGMVPSITSTFRPFCSKGSQSGFKVKFPLVKKIDDKGVYQVTAYGGEDQAEGVN